jgi:hypothetical protein
MFARTLILLLVVVSAVSATLERARSSTATLSGTVLKLTWLDRLAGALHRKALLTRNRRGA